MKILFCASEVAPFAKTGGLADVAGSLPPALGELGLEVVIAMPRYRGIKLRKKALSENVRIYFIENEAYFNRASLYGGSQGDYPDNLERFSFFCREVFALAKRIGFKPDILHANDWQTALLPVLLKRPFSSDAFFEKTKTVLTIHNIAYQGNFPHRLYPVLGLPDELFSVKGFGFYSKISLLKAGLLFSDGINTVSPMYAEEIKTKVYGFGLEGVIRERQDRLRGILNGIDTALWDPARDRWIKEIFSAKEPDGKRFCKEDLQKLCGFEVNPDIPVFGMVTRLAEQKGLELLSEIAERFLSKPVQFVLVGDGDDVYQTMLKNIRARHPGNTAVFLGFHTAEAHQIYAGADFFLMPSFFEPCGLGQLISLRYGTVPVVRRTGGLADTIPDADENPKTGNGFVFDGHSPEAFLKAIERGLLAFQDKKRFTGIQKIGMKADFSWHKSALEYKKFYREILTA